MIYPDQKPKSEQLPEGLSESVTAGSSQDPNDLLMRLQQGGKLTQRQVRRTRELQSKTGGDAQLAIQKLGYVGREDMLKALSQRFSYPIFDDMPDNVRFAPELVAGHQPFGAAAEAIRSIRSTIASTSLANGTRSFVVVGPHQDTGVTYLACNLAVSFAQMAIPTLLVDANLRNPRMDSVFGFPPGTPGLSDYLVSRGQAPPTIQSNVLPKLSVLLAGSIPPNPQELLSSPDFLALTDNFHDQFGVVLYDTAACDEFSDALVVCSRVNAAIIVARRHKTRYKDISRLVKKLESIRCSVVGTVFNQH
jgi:protein-tyrosine kinase